MESSILALLCSCFNYVNVKIFLSSVFDAGYLHSCCDSVGESRTFQSRVFLVCATYKELPFNQEVGSQSVRAETKVITRLFSLHCIMICGNKHNCGCVHECFVLLFYSFFSHS